MTGTAMLHFRSPVLIVGNRERRARQLEFWRDTEVPYLEKQIANGDRSAYWRLHCEAKPMIRALEISLKGVRA
jgi:hypothetical protein